MADDLKDFEPVAWERGDGKILYQPRFKDERSWEVRIFGNLFLRESIRAEETDIPHLVRSKRKAVRIARKWAKWRKKQQLTELTS